MSLVQMSVTGGALVLVILLLRALSRNRLPKATFLLLWWAALARLLLPFSLPFRFSFYALLGPGAGAMPPGGFGAAGSEWAGPQTVLLPADASGGVLSPWALLWLVGAAGSGLYFLCAYWRCRRSFGRARPVQNDFTRRWLEGHPLWRGLSIRQCDAVASPLTYGILRPVILMPPSTDWSQAQTLDYVLTHEYIHIRRFDAAAKLLLTAALCLHWFNPLVWAMVVLAGRDIELSCDEAVVRRFGAGARAGYARALIRMEEGRSRPAVFCSGFSKNAMEERIVSIMKAKKITVPAIVVSVLLAAGIPLAFATSPTVPGTTLASEQVLLRSEPSHPVPDPIEWWTVEEYEQWLEQEKKELQALVGTGSGWYDAQGRFHPWTQEATDQCIRSYEQQLRELKAGKRISKPIDANSDGYPELTLSMLEPETESRSDGTVRQDSLGTAPAEPFRADAFSGPQAQETADSLFPSVFSSDSAASEDDSRQTMEAFARRMERYAPLGITYRPERGGNVYYQGRLIRSFVDEAPTGSVLSVRSARGGWGTYHTVYDPSGLLIGVEKG